MRARPATFRPLMVAALAVLTLLAAAAQALAAAPDDEIALAERYAPVVRLHEPSDPCGPGEPYQPTDVNVLMGSDEVALRGPWDTTNIVEIGPEAETLERGLPGYHLDFPGETLRPGCTFEEWSARMKEQAPPTTYARAVVEEAYPGKLALQYWFFYLFNDWNNAHEGDWEMIQIVFDAATPAEALREQPVEVGYSQHSSAERAAWGDPKLELVDGTHPVVYPAEGSNANFFSADIFLMRSQAEGVGCDDAQAPSVEVRPVVATVPMEPGAYLRDFPWLGFQGRWGERQAGVFNGPTGPNMKTSWTEPITWSEESWRDRSFAVPAGGALGTTATDVFCGVIAAGSEVLRRVKANPGVALVVIGGLAVLLVWALSRTSWSPSAPLPLARRRSWGHLLRAALAMFGRHPRLFMGIGLLFVPLGLLITLIQWILFRATMFAPLLDETGERNAFTAGLALVLGLVFTLLGYATVQAATAWAARATDEGRAVDALDAYRAVLPRWRDLLVALLVLAGVQLLLDSTVVLIPVAVFLLVRWSLLGIVVGSEDEPRPGVLRRSARLARGSWWRVAGIVLVAAAALAAGPVVGVLVLLVTGAAFDLVNLIAALVYVVALPLAALVQTYLYHDLRLRPEPVAEDEDAPAGAASPA
ncbi:MAG: hypothetical protein AB7V62_11750 [Thermoleophilia bacterium]